MYIYYILLFIISFLGFIFFKDGTTPKRNKYFLICSFFLLFLVQSLRKYTVGVDVPTYVEGFYQIRNMPWNDCRLHDWEPLYAYLNKLIGCFTDRYSVLLSAASFIILVGCGYFIYKNSTNVFWPVFLFIVLDNFFISMYSLRQFCAIAIGINIYTVLKENTSVKNYIKAGILFLLAIMFHVTAFVCILFFAVFWAGKMSKFKLILWLLMGIFGILYFSKIVDFFLFLFPRYDLYRSRNTANFQGTSVRNIDLVYDLIKIMCIFIMWKFNHANKGHQHILKLLSLSCVAIILSFLVTKIKLVWRFTFYFDILLIVVIPLVIEKFKYHRYVAYAAVYLSGFIYLSYIMLLNGGKCVPYLTFWQ